ncbi:hypothetical protein [Paracoccus albus]|uniref:hypothetical protein n=1 Tax=Paracoccus albus TaxID=3017784 RepID=UPI0022F05107|nr:hypothetical protein [Paracoccus albus]WBU59822.1 hypothetical protein PAF20_13850 [Paracoccus albus]
MGIVAAMTVTEPVVIDRRRLQDIVFELGEIAAERLIQQALEQMALAVSAVLDDPVPRRVAENAGRLARLAGQVGLTSLADVAGDLTTCAGQCDGVALRAVLMRLERVANRSLTEIWDEFCPDLAPGPQG